MVITRDPDKEWVNLGVYRGMVQSHNRLSLWINPMKHGRIIVERYWRDEKPAPVAVVLGCEPVTWMSASPPFGTSEYEMAGAYRGTRWTLFDCRARNCWFLRAQSWSSRGLSHR